MDPRSDDLGDYRCLTEDWCDVQDAYTFAIALRISVMQSGRLFGNGTEVSLVDLDAQLQQLEIQNGVVWYYREEPQGKAPAVVTDVIGLVAKHGRPIAMCREPDFSDMMD